MKKTFSKLLAVCLVMALTLSLAACTKKDDAGSGSGDAAKGKKVGLAMPTKDLQRWVQDGDNMQKKFKEAGYDVDLQYANNDIATQVSQIENMISKGNEILVIAAIDGTALGTVLKTAKEKGIKVIAYDRLIMETDAVSYYATFDNYLVGQLQGKYIEEKLGLKDGKGPFNIELFTGSSDDNNVNFFFGGAMDVLTPYIESGKLVVPSGAKTKAECATPNWSTEEAQKRMENIIAANYSNGQKLDAVLSSNDSVANGITNALVASYNGDFPILTGQDCDITAVKNIIADKQSMSIFKDTRQLADKVVEMVTAIVEGKDVPVNDTKTYDNGTGIIPSFLCEPVFADKDNYKKLLVDSGYYKEDQLK